MAEISDYTIQPATKEDLNEVLAWLEAGGDDRPDFSGNRKAIAKGQSQGNLSVLTRNSDDLLIGFLLSGDRSMDFMEIKLEFRRKKLGRLLAEHGLRRIEKAGEFGVIIECDPAPSIDFWKAIGFRHVMHPYGRDDNFYAFYAFPNSVTLPRDAEIVPVRVAFSPADSSSQPAKEVFRRSAAEDGEKEFALNERVATVVGVGETTIEVFIGDELISAATVERSAKLGVKHKNLFVRIDRLAWHKGDEQADD
jgi:ribosomal protein S18 acetylase RimI-like enzyme